MSKKVYRTCKQQVKQLSKDEYLILKELCHTSKHLWNEALYLIRSHYRKTGEHLFPEKVDKLLKTSQNYKKLGCHISRHVLYKIDESYQRFFTDLKHGNKTNPPKYIDKKGYFSLYLDQMCIKNNIFKISYSYSFRKTNTAKKCKEIWINMPTPVIGKNIKLIQIAPRQNARYFEIIYTYVDETDSKGLDQTNALAIDLGINNFCTCVTTAGKSFIIDGRWLKSKLQWSDKQLARLTSIHSRQENKLPKPERKYMTNQMYRIYTKMTNINEDFCRKSARYIINYCIKNNIGTIVLGYSTGFTKRTNLGKVNNQTISKFPYYKFKSKLIALCKYYNMQYVEQEESYTSKASFFDDDFIHVYDPKNKQEYNFLGKRSKRGLYQTSKGYYLNADVNGALNILKKSKVVDTSVLYNRGVNLLGTPVRIRVN